MFCVIISLHVRDVSLSTVLVTALPAFGGSDICDKDQKYLDSCVQQLPSLMSRDSTTGIPSSKKALEQACT